MAATTATTSSPAVTSGGQTVIEMHEAGHSGDGGTSPAPTTTPDGTTLQNRVTCGWPTGIMGAALAAETAGIIATAYLGWASNNPEYYVGTGLFIASEIGTGFGGYYAYKFQQMGPLIAQVKAMTQNVARLGAVENDIKQRDLELGQIREQLQTTEASLRNTAGKLEKAEGDLKATSSQLEASAKELGDLKKTQDANLAELAKDRQTLSQTKDQLASLTQERERLTGDQTKTVQQLTQQNEALVTTNKQLTLQISAMQASLDKLKTILQGYVGQNKVFQDAVAKMGKGTEALTGEDQRLVESIHALGETRRTENADFDKELDALTKEVQQSKSISDGLITMLASQNQKLQGQIATLGQTVAGFQREEQDIAEKTKALEQLQHDTQAAQSRLEELAAQLSQTEAALEKAKAELSPLEAKLGTTAERVDHQADDVHRLNTSLETMIASLGTAVAGAETKQHHGPVEDGDHEQH